MQNNLLQYYREPLKLFKTGCFLLIYSNVFIVQI